MLLAKSMRHDLLFAFWLIAAVVAAIFALKLAASPFFIVEKTEILGAVSAFATGNTARFWVAALGSGCCFFCIIFRHNLSQSVNIRWKSSLIA